MRQSETDLGPDWGRKDKQNHREEHHTSDSEDVATVLFVLGEGRKLRKDASPLPEAQSLKRWMTKRIERNKRAMVRSDKYWGSGVLLCCY